MKSISTIKNPLTIIAIFAGIVEISGTGVLPFLEVSHQGKYIWFLMLFPSMLVVLFFGALFFKREALYAPSDWRDEDNFFRKFAPASREEGDRKLERELEETEVSVESSDDCDVTDAREATSAQNSGESDQSPANTLQFQVTPKKRASSNISSRLQRYADAEHFGLLKLERETHLRFERSVRFQSDNAPSMIFDGITQQGREIHIAEVKYLRRGDPRTVLSNILPSFKLAALEFAQAGKTLVLHLVIVADEALEKEREASLAAQVQAMSKNYGLNVKLHRYLYDELSAD